MKPTSQQFLTETIQLAKTVRESMVVIGGRLIKIKEDGLWEGSFETWESFTEAIDMSPASASRIMTVYREWIEQAHFTVEEIAHVGISNLYAGRNLLETKSKEDALATVETLRRSDVEKLVKGEVADHEHKIISYCTICRERVYEAE